MYLEILNIIILKIILVRKKPAVLRTALHIYIIPTTIIKSGLNEISDLLKSIMQD